MNRQNLMDKAIQNLSQLSDEKLKEVTDFCEFLLAKKQDKVLVEGIHKIMTGSKSFEFLEEEEDLYTEDDLEEKFR